MAEQGVSSTKASNPQNLIHDESHEERDDNEQATLLQKNSATDKNAQFGVTTTSEKMEVAVDLKLAEDATERERTNRPMCAEEEKSPTREHGMEQEMVDYEEDEILPSIPRKSETENASTLQTGERSQPPKISWNAWAGHATTDTNTKRPSDTKRQEKRGGDMILNDAPRVADSHRKSRDEMHEVKTPKFIKGEAFRFQRDSQRTGRDGRERSPLSRRYGRNYPARQQDTPPSLRRGGPSVQSRSSIPPSMNYIKRPLGPNLVHSRPLEPSRSTTRPFASRVMPPGLGVTGTVSRNFPHSVRQGPAGSRSTLVPRHTQFERTNSPPPRYLRPSRPVSSPGRQDRYKISHSPCRREDVFASATNRTRSPPRIGSVTQEARTDFRKLFVRRQPSQPQQRDEFLEYQARTGVQPVRVRDAAPASPRRYTPPDKRQSNRRYLDERHPEPEHNRILHSRSLRIGPSGQQSPREYRKQPIGQNGYRTAPTRRSPPPMHNAHRHHPRPPSIPTKTRRELHPAYQRLDEPNRPEFSDDNFDHRMYGGRFEQGTDRRGETHTGLYGNAGRDPPSSPERQMKRQKPSPATETQRFRREPVHFRNAVVGSPNTNPPTIDDGSGSRSHYPENEYAWYYVDPQGNTQGPCTIEQFRSWLRRLADDPQFEEEHRQFMYVDVWKEGQQNTQIMASLLERNAP